MISQPYLSLGLTPVSQLSPDPLMSSSTGTSELGFFPSMLPPISPVSSMMNANGGLPMDDDMTDNQPPLDNLVMPDGLVSYNLAPVDPHKVKNKTKTEQQRPDGTRLETVMEHSSLEADDLSSSFSGFSSRLVDSKGGVNTLNTSMSTTASDQDELIFPSADGQSPLTSRKQPNTGGGGLGFDSDFSMFPSAFNNTATSISLSKLHQPTTSNGNIGQSSRSSTNMLDSFMDFDSVTPNEQAKQRRIQAREKAIAEQKAVLLEKERKESMERTRLNQERQSKIAQDYATFASSTNQKKTRGAVLQQIGMFEAAAELNDEKISQEKRSQELTSPTRSPRYGITGLVSPHHSYSGRPRKPSNDSLDPKPVEDQVTIL